MVRDRDRDLPDSLSVQVELLCGGRGLRIAAMSAPRRDPIGSRRGGRPRACPPARARGRVVARGRRGRLVRAPRARLPWRPTARSRRPPASRPAASPRRPTACRTADARTRGARGPPCVRRPGCPRSPDPRTWLPRSSAPSATSPPDAVADHRDATASRGAQPGLAVDDGGAPQAKSLGIGGRGGAVAGARGVEAQRGMAGLGELGGPEATAAVRGHVVPAERRAEQDSEICRVCGGLVRRAEDGRRARR